MRSKKGVPIREKFLQADAAKTRHGVDLENRYGNESSAAVFAAAVRGGRPRNQTPVALSGSSFGIGQNTALQIHSMRAPDSKAGKAAGAWRPVQADPAASLSITLAPQTAVALKCRCLSLEAVTLIPESNRKGAVGHSIDPVRPQSVSSTGNPRASQKS